MKEFKLDNQKIDSGFTHPEGYFEMLSDKINQKITKPETKVISISKRIWYYAAAAVIVVLLSFPAYNYFFTKKQDVDPAALENYILYQSSISEDEIVNLLNEKDLQKININLNLDDKTIENTLYSNSDLEQYFLN